MKKILRAAVLLMLAAIMIVSAGCAAKVDWDSLKRDAVVAETETGELKLVKATVSLQNAINEYTNEQLGTMFSELGTDAGEMVTSEETALNEMCAYLMLSQKAADDGMLISDDEAREYSYSDFILSAKQSSDIKAYTEELKEKLHLSDDLLVEQGIEYEKYIKSADNVISAEFEKLNAEDYENINDMADAVAEKIADMMKDNEVTAYYPTEHTIKGSELDFATVVSTVKWNYSSLFY